MGGPADEVGSGRPSCPVEGLQGGPLAGPARPGRGQPRAVAATTLTWLMLAGTTPGGAMAQAQTQTQAVAPAGTRVVFSGKMGTKALLVINGTPRTVAVGTTEQGVRLVSVNGDSAMIEADGQRRTLALGGQVDLSGAPTPGSGTRIVMSVGSGGHFSSAGSINGRAVQFMVDTGASVVALSQGEAERIGLDYKKAPRGLVQTANGQVPVHSVRLSTVRVGEVQVHDVEAVVMPADMPSVLLGNSFLRRFQLQQTNDTMTLVKKP